MYQEEAVLGGVKGDVHVNRAAAISKYLHCGLFEYCEHADGSYHFPFVNDELSNILGLQPDEFDLKFSSLLLDNGVKFEAGLMQAAAQGSPLLLETWIKTPTGERRWIQLSASLQHSADLETLRCWFGYVIDLSHQKLLQDRLEASEGRLRLMLDHMPTSIACLSVEDNNRILLVNQSFDRLFGFNQSECPTVSDWFLKAYPDVIQREETLQAWRRFLTQTNPPGPVEMRLKSSEGEDIWVQINVSFLDDLLLVAMVDITAHKQQENQLRHMAQHDSLTQALNRWAFEMRLDHSITLAKRNQNSVALLFVDLDYFKQVNDTYGHDVGDVVLVETVQRMQAMLRESDAVGRMGGDEFVAVLGEIEEAAGAYVVAQKIRQALNQPVISGDITIPISASIGIALYPQNGQGAEALYKHADLGLYLAKSEGRNTVRMFLTE